MSTDQLIVKKLRNAKLRAQAEIAYVANPDCPTLEELRADSRFEHVSQRTLERWCKAGRWVQKRQEYLERWTQKARDRIGSQLAQERLHEITMLQEMRDLARDKLTDPSTLPRSWEGVAKAFVDLVKTLDEQREKLTEVVAGGSATAGALSIEGDAEFSDAELSAATAAFLEQRRAKQQSAIAATAGAVDQPDTELVSEIAEEDEEDDAEIFNEEPNEPSDV